MVAVTAQAVCGVDSALQIGVSKELCDVLVVQHNNSDVVIE